MHRRQQVRKHRQVHQPHLLSEPHHGQGVRRASGHQVPPHVPLRDERYPAGRGAGVRLTTDFGRTKVPQFVCSNDERKLRWFFKQKQSHFKVLGKCISTAVAQNSIIDLQTFQHL